MIFLKAFRVTVEIVAIAKALLNPGLFSFTMFNQRRQFIKFLLLFISKLVQFLGCFFLFNFNLFAFLSNFFLFCARIALPGMLLLLKIAPWGSSNEAIDANSKTT